MSRHAQAVNHIRHHCSRLARMKPINSTRALFVVILMASALTRCALISRGGQFFFPDEDRYLLSRLVAQNLWDGRIVDALAAFGGIPHLGFKIAGMVPAFVEIVLGEHVLIPALFFSLFSVANIAIVWFLALRSGADEKEALWAVFLLSTSNTFFYYSSHLLSYDLALMFGLLALYTGLRDTPDPWLSILTGFLVFLTL